MRIGKFAITTLSLKNAKQRYYFDLIEECGGDTRKLFQVVQSLSNKPEEDQLPPHDDPCKLADDYGEFFCRKVDLIRTQMSSAGHKIPTFLFHP